jgi:hypothetical protein
VTAAACGGRGRARLVQPDRPEPDVDPDRVDAAIVPPGTGGCVALVA